MPINPLPAPTPGHDRVADVRAPGKAGRGPACPKCQRDGHEIGGLTHSKWTPYREPVQLDAERVIHRSGYRLVGGMRLICDEGHIWTQERPKDMQPKRPARSRPRRGF